MARNLTLFLCGDVMTGRGIDQILPRPAPARLYESCVDSAQGYVRLAEARNGPILRPESPSEIWGEALRELDIVRPDARVVNLETSVTLSEDAEDKGINYRMSPHNVGVLTGARVDCCVLANNHVLDWGEVGLLETLATLQGAGIRTAGAGRNADEAAAPAVVETFAGARLLVFAFAHPSSGVPHRWAATAHRPGVNVLPELSPESLQRVGETVVAAKRAGDVVVVSLHWGGNWGFEIPQAQQAFARGLIDEAGVDVVHGHSSHHVKGIEVYRGKLILYGCGDFLNDYEGIAGYAEFRDDLAVMYFPEIRPGDGALVSCRLTPVQIRRFRLNRPGPQDLAWLRATLLRACARFEVSLDEVGDEGGRFSLRWR